MWQVRLSGIQTDSFKFLSELTENYFSKEEVIIDGNIYCFYYFHLTEPCNSKPSEVIDFAKKELLVYKSFLMINNFSSNIQCNQLLEVMTDGNENIHMIFQDTINVTDSFDMYVNNEHAYSSEKSKLETSKQILNNIQSNKVKKELFKLISTEISWANTFKIYEILKNHEELRNFAHSANPPEAIGINEARHAVQNTKSPKKIANLPLAHQILVNLSLQFLKKANDS